MQLIFHPCYLEHETGVHPENAERLKWALNEECVKPESGEEFLGLVHSQEYIERVRQACEREVSLDIDTMTSQKSFESACFAVGGTVKASEEGGFALVRPPGHHAPRGGFCLFNNMAIAAVRLANMGKKVLIVDWDVHHGNGTQELVVGKPGIQYISTHQSPFYPGTGLESVANCTNLPLSAGTNDEEYLRVLEPVLERALKEFDPEYVGVSAGFDSMRGDPLGGFELTEHSYLQVCELIKSRNCFFVLEGGYSPLNVERAVKSIVEFFG
ncbi:histone deacetylase [archaeon]|nr:histone deacetylase [archaeon]